MEFAARLKPAHLELILRIAETGQLQRAAQMAGMTQPAASRILAELEVRAGGSLFDRHPKGMTLTQLGQICLRHGKVISEEYGLLDRELSRVAEGAAGHVRVGAVTGPAVGVLMPAIRQVRSATPDVEVTIDVGPSTHLVRGLVSGRYDFVISRLPADHDSRDFRLYPARSEDVSLLVRPGHPLDGAPGITLNRLRDNEWVMQEPGSPIRQAVETAFHMQGVQAPDRVTNSSSLLVVLSLLQATDVIAPQAREVAQMLGAQVARLDLVEPITVPPCFVIRDRYRQISVAAEHLLRAVLDHL